VADATTRALIDGQGPGPGERFRHLRAIRLAVLAVRPALFGGFGALGVLLAAALWLLRPSEAEREYLAGLGSRKGNAPGKWRGRCPRCRSDANTSNMSRRRVYARGDTRRNVHPARSAEVRDAHFPNATLRVLEHRAQ